VRGRRPQGDAKCPLAGIERGVQMTLLLIPDSRCHEAVDGGSFVAVPAVSAWSPFGAVTPLRFNLAPVTAPFLILAVVTAPFLSLPVATAAFFSCLVPILPAA